MPITEIDNPGKGNCGFYAVAIGLIHIIQTEHRVNKSEIFNHLHAYCPTISLSDILEFDLSQPASSSKDKTKLLNTIQMTLRQLTCTFMIDELKTAIKDEAKLERGLNPTLVDSTILFSLFMELVNYFSGRKKKEKLSDFNFLTSSKDVMNLAKETAETLPLTPEDSFAVIEMQTNAHAKKTLLEDVQKPNSSILTACKILTKQGYWATHQYLNCLTELFPINITVNGEQNGKLDQSKPTLVLKNHHNSHWTTLVDLDEPIKALPSTLQCIVTHTVLSQSDALKRKDYEKHLNQLLHLIATKEGLFAKRHHAIELTQINTACAMPNESDEDFALRLQEAELRNAGYRRK